jgi:hypothetical protein
MVSRRAFVGGLLAAASLPFPGTASAQDPAASPDPDFEIKDLLVDAPGRRFTLLVPRHLAPGERVPLLVLLHGLGETGDVRAGAYAWLERYGLRSAYERLRRAPIARTSKRADWTDARLTEVNAALAAQRFRGLAIACPYTPNVQRAPEGPSAALDAYARWIETVLLPRARKEAPVFTDAAHTFLDGCSLGGFVGLEVFLRRPALFGAWGGVQSAFGAHRAAGYAERLDKAIAAAGPRKLHLETSTGDPFKDANLALSSALKQRGVPHDLLIAPGPHDQPWLRETGTLEMLLWHDRLPR